jgi:hypothetical protein
VSEFTGRTWQYRDDSVQIGDLTPVSSYAVGRDDLTPTTPDACGYVLTGFVEVVGWDEIPDPAYYGGIRREMRVAGPVVNRNRSVVLDDAPVCVRVEK